MHTRLGTCREDIDAKRSEAEAVELELQKLDKEEREAQQTVDSLQQQCQELKAEADRQRELQKATEANVSHPSWSRLLLQLTLRV